MTLLSPWMLSFLFVLPLIVLLYLLKRTYENMPVPSILLWQKLLREMEANRPWQKLRRNLLLLLQLLMAALLAFALARPALPAGGPVADHTLVVLDLSPSMAALASPSGKETRLEHSKSEIQSLIRQLRADQRMTLIGMGEEARILAAGNDPSDLEKALDAAAQEYGKADYEGALSLAAALSSKDPNSDVRIYSDGNWGIDPTLLPHFGRAPLLMLSAKDAKSGVNNVSILHAAAQVNGERAALVATLQNNGTGERTVEVQVQDSAGKELDAREVKVASAKQQALSWDALPVQDAYKVVIKQPDDFTLDNERTVLPERAATAKAWLATEGNVFLEKALSLGGALSVEKASDPGSPPPDAALYVYDGTLPSQWPNGAVLLVNPPRGTGLVTIGDDQDPGKLQTLMPDSPVLQHVDLSSLHLKKVRQAQASWLQPLVKSGDTPILLTGEQNGHRLAVLPFDLHESDLPLLPSFPILIKNLRSYLLPVSGTTLGTQTAGVRVALLPPIREDGWTYADPNGTAHTVDKTLIEQGFRPALPGLYRFQSGDAKQTRLLAVTLPAEESQIAPTAVALPSGTGQESGTAAQPDPASGAMELWRYAAMALLLLLFVEWGVYKRGY